MTRDQEIEILTLFKNNCEPTEIRFTDNFNKLRSAIGSTKLNIYDKELINKQYLTHRGNTLSQAGLFYLDQLMDEQKKAKSNECLRNTKTILELIARSINILLMILTITSVFWGVWSNSKVNELENKLLKNNAMNDRKTKRLKTDSVIIANQKAKIDSLLSVSN